MTVLLYTGPAAMNINSRVILILLCAFLIMAGCTKIPEKLMSATVRIEQTIKDNKELYSLKLNGGIQNENSDIALMNVRGTIVFYNSGSGNATIMALPFTLPAVLPFETGVVEITKTYSENEIMPLVTLLGSDKEKLITDKGLERTLSDDKKVRLEISGYKKEKILDLIERKVNEKI